MALSAILDAIPSVVFAKDVEGRYLIANPAAAAILGVSAKDMIGKTDLELSDPATAQTVRDQDRAIMASGVATREEVVVEDPAGKKVWFLREKVPLLNPGGTVVGIIGTALDITDSKLAEQLAAERAESVLASEAMRTRFLASASHDLRQPLQAIVMLLSTLERHVSPSGANLLARADAATLVIKTMLDNMLDITLLDSGLMTPNLVSFPINEVASPVAQDFRAIAALNGVEIVNLLADRAVSVRSDRIMLTRMIACLVENAVRFTPSGNITIDGEFIGNDFRISVRDTGIGISPADIGFVWDEFFQVANRGRDRAQGAGIGLSVVRRLANLLGHEVSVSSALGRGSIFSIQVPMTVAAVSQFPRPAALPPQTPEEQPYLPYVLLVEDDIMIRETIGFTLEDMGFRVSMASSMQDALALLDGDVCPDVMLLDYRLKNESGIDVARAVRARCKGNVPAVLLTGDLAQSVGEQAAAEGIRVLHKPVSFDELFSVLHNVRIAA